jgi:hypothetical protein
MIGCQLLRDAAAGGHAEDVDRPIECVPERRSVLGRQRAHGQPDGQAGAPVDIDHATRARPWPGGLFVHPAHRPGRDSYVR